jgi:hypothetical protein
MITLLKYSSVPEALVGGLATGIFFFVVLSLYK